MFVLVVVLVVIRTHATCRGNGNDDDGGDSAMNVYCKGNDCGGVQVGAQITRNYGGYAVQMDMSIMSQ